MLPELKRLKNRLGPVAWAIPVCLFFSGFLLDEVRDIPPDLNDEVLHLTCIKAVSSSLPDLRRATDPWIASPGMGFPVFHYYQHVYYFPVAVLHRLLGQDISIRILIRLTRALALLAFPFILYASMRRCGFETTPSAFSAVFALLLSDKAGFGWTFESYMWSGSGLWTQLWSMVLMPLSFSWGYVFLRDGKGCFPSVALLVATCLGHLVTGYITVISLFVTAVALDPARGPVRVRLTRLAVLLGLTALVGSYFFVPFFLDNAYFNRSVWEEQAKYDSYGHEKVFQWLVTGQLLDAHRYVPLTIFLLIGVVTAFQRWAEQRARVIAILFMVWLSLFCGRPTWGRLLDLMPFSSNLHFHRLIAGFDFFSLILAGLGAAALVRLIRLRLPARASWMAGAVLALLIVPAVVERGLCLSENNRWRHKSRSAFEAEGRDLREVMACLRAMPPGRVYAGLGGTWGHLFAIGWVPIYGVLQAEGFDCLGYLYHAMSLNGDLQVLFNDSDPVHYRLFNVAYVVAGRDWRAPGFLHPVRTVGRFAIYRNDPQSYFDVVQSDVAYKGRKADWYPAASAWLYSPAPASRRFPRIVLARGEFCEGPYRPLSKAAEHFSGEKAPQAPLNHPGGGDTGGGVTPGAVLSERVLPDRLEADVDARRDAYVMCKVTYHPNWQVLVDGQEQRSVMLMPSFLGVGVPEGKHTVVFAYAPGSFRLWLMLAGVAGLALVFVAERRRSRRTAAPPSSGQQPEKKG